MVDNQQYNIKVLEDMSAYPKRLLSNAMIGSVLGLKPADFLKMELSQRNAYLISRVSEFTSLTNQDYFDEHIHAFILDDSKDYIRRSHYSIKDGFGRVSFFYIQFGNMKISIP